MRMKTAIQTYLLLAILPVSPALAEWKPIEKIETYAISGQTGLELHASMAERGPIIGKGKVRAMAYTDFKLTWVRDYQPQGNACVLRSARPKLVITHIFPKPAEPLPAAVQKSWEVFAAGLVAHEKVHGDLYEDMTRKIEAATIGLTVPDDPGCSKIRTEVIKRLAELSQARQKAIREFDRVEFAPRGNLQQLVVNLLMGR